MRRTQQLEHGARGSHRIESVCCRSHRTLIKAQKTTTTTTKRRSYPQTTPPLYPSFLLSLYLSPRLCFFHYAFLVTAFTLVTCSRYVAVPREATPRVARTLVPYISRVETLHATNTPICFTARHSLPTGWTVVPVSSIRLSVHACFASPKTNMCQRKPIITMFHIL